MPCRSIGGTIVLLFAVDEYVAQDSSAAPFAAQIMLSTVTVYIWLYPLCSTIADLQYRMLNAMWLAGMHPTIRQMAVPVTGVIYLYLQKHVAGLAKPF